MFNKCLFSTRGQELLDEARVPQFTRNTKILTAAHQGIGLAAFCGSWDAIRIEVLLFAAGN